MPVNACTIIAKNYVAQARVLARSFARHHPDGRFTVLVLDELDGRMDPAGEPFEVLGGRDLHLPEFLEMASRYDVLEMSTAVKPWLLRHLLRDADHVVYLDPDIEVFGDLSDLAELARKHGMVLTPHNTTPMPRDGRKPSEADILIAGSYNLGFIALGAGTAADAFLDWWSERLLDDCVVDTARGYFVDQRWIDLVPGMREDLHVLRDPGYNVAYWNLHARTVARGPGGDVTVNGRPLRFFHFSGYDPARPEELSKHQDRVHLAGEPVVRELCDAYGAALLAEGHEEARSWPYTYALTAGGMPLDRVTRRLYAEGLRQGALRGTLFDPEGAAAFTAWALERADEALDPRVNRWMAGVRELRDDLKAAYPDVAGPGVEGFLEWLRVHARAQLGPAADVFVPAPPQEPAAQAVAAPPPPAPLTAPPAVAVNLVGYLNAELGVGEVARQATLALDAAGVPVLPVRVDAPHSRQEHAFAGVTPDAAAFPVNLLCVNADQTPAVAAQLGPSFFAGRRTVGWWWWEAPLFPAEMRGAFAHVDEVWAGSRFIADTLASVSPVPVVQVPTPVQEPRGGALDREALGIPDGFLFLFAFDFHSVVARKNPIGLVEAFRRAFAPDDGAVLVLKTINGDAHPVAKAELVAACVGRHDIVLVDRYLTASEKDGLLATCDAYVSLHRSEGFGYTMAEAMLLGRPVIATGWSGNADFLTEATGFPVRHERVRVGAGHAPYPAEARWAEPDLEHAVEQLRRVMGDPQERERRARAGQAFVREHHSPAAAGAVMAARLAVLAAQTDGAVEPARAREVAEAVVQRGPVRSPRSARDPRRVLRGALLRAAKPVLTYQQEVARAALDALAAEEAGLRRSLAEARAHGLADLRRARRRLDEVAGEHEQLQDGVVRSLTEHEAHIRALEAFSDRAAPSLAQADRLAAAADAVPHMEGRPFTLEGRPGVGQALGFRGAGTTGYRVFEDVFRGSEDLIRERQRRYLPLLAPSGPVVDVGCGRGEMLDLLRDEGREAVGIDLDASMLERAREKGHDALVHGDAVAWLEAAGPASVGTVFSAQVVEHLDPTDLDRLLAAARRALQPGGRLILETVNPHAPGPLKAFWVDPTHHHPLFPEVLLQLCREAGFVEGFAFMPNGTGDYEADRRTSGEYAVVATTAAA